MRKYYIFIWIGLISIVAACTGDGKLTNSAKLCQEFIEEKGYEIVSHEGTHTYKVSPANLNTLSSEFLWSVQTVSPEEYLGEALVKVEFFVRNHPLDQYFYGRQPYYLDKTHITFYLFEGEIIGGTSFPASSEPLNGAYYSLDGKTIEDIHGSYKSWYKNWMDIIEKVDG